MFSGSDGALTLNPNSDRYYITNFGIPRKWAGPPGGGAWNADESAWQQRPGTCKGGDMNIVVHISQAHLNEFKSAATEKFGSQYNERPMRINEPCGVSGKFVQVTETGNKAWVDILGNKHLIDSTVTDPTCTVSNPITITQDSFDAIPGDDVVVGACGATGLGATEFTDFIRLQSELIAAGVVVMESVNKLVEQNIPEVQNRIAEERGNLEESVNELVSQQRQISTNQTNAVNAMGRFETGEEQTTYTLRMYVVWLIVALLVMAITIHTMVSGENTIFVYGVLGVCALIMVYYSFVRATRG